MRGWANAVARRRRVEATEDTGMILDIQYPQTVAIRLDISPPDFATKSKTNYPEPTLNPVEY